MNENIESKLRCFSDMAPPMPLWDIAVMAFSWMSLFTYLLVCVVVFIRRKHISSLQKCFLKLAILNSLCEVALFLCIEIVIRARRYSLLPFYQQLPPSYLAVPSVCLSMSLRCGTFLGFITLAINRFTAIIFPMRYRQIWSTKTAIVVCLLNWTIAFALTIAAVIVGNPTGSFYFSSEGTIEISYIFSGAQLLSYIGILLCVFAVVVCTCLYASLGYVILRAKLKQRNMDIGKGELRYLLCAILTFVPLILELTRSIIEWSSFVNGGQIVTTSKKMWISSHDLMLGIQFFTFIFITRLYRLIPDVLFSKKNVPVVSCSAMDSQAGKLRNRHGKEMGFARTHRL
uniref:G-protein coupled receptors family 1 profile domain-containing protein n=1 Tax=Haemonchus contortus TaxID=6289 RepID=A0A912MQL2_HAECO